jgi:hypothetical protein
MYVVREHGGCVPPECLHHDVNIPGGNKSVPPGCIHESFRKQNFGKQTWGGESVPPGCMNENLECKHKYTASIHKYVECMHRIQAAEHTHTHSHTPRRGHGPTRDWDHGGCVPRAVTWIEQ